MGPHKGDYTTSDTVRFMFDSFSSDDPSASVTITGFAVGDIQVYKDGSATQRSSTSGFTATTDFDTITGVHLVAIDLSDNTDAGFFADGSEYDVVVSSVTIDGATINFHLGSFSIGRIQRVNAVQISGDSTAADNLELDYDGTGYNKSNSTIGTCTANTDMRGTDSAFLAANAPTNFSDLSITASTGLVDITQTAADKAWSTTTRVLTANTNLNDPTAAAIADAVWDEAQSGHTTGGTFGEIATEIASILADTNELQADDVPGLIAALNDPTAAAIADAVWDEVITSAQHNVNNSAAKFLRESSEGIGATGTAQSGTANTIVLASGGVTNDDILNGERIRIIEGTGVGQSRLILDSVASTDTVTVDRNWTVNPDNTSVYSITGADADIRMIEGDNTAADNFLAFFDGTGYAGGTTNLDVNIVSSDDIDLTATQKTSVNAEVDTALATTTYAEPSSVPAATASLKDKIGWITALSRNKLTSTSTTQTLRNDADSADIGSVTHSDDGTTFTRPEWS